MIKEENKFSENIDNDSEFQGITWKKNSIGILFLKILENKILLSPKITLGIDNYNYLPDKKDFLGGSNPFYLNLNPKINPIKRESFYEHRRNSKRLKKFQIEKLRIKNSKESICNSKEKIEVRENYKEKLSFLNLNNENSINKEENVFKKESFTKIRKESNPINNSNYDFKLITVKGKNIYKKESRNNQTHLELDDNLLYYTNRNLNNVSKNTFFWSADKMNQIRKKFEIASEKIKIKTEKDFSVLNFLISKGDKERI
jgi:hypothetical protein